MELCGTSWVLHDILIDSYSINNFTCIFGIETNIKNGKREKKRVHITGNI